MGRKLIVLLSLITLLCIGLSVSCGPSEEELQKQKLEVERQAEREQVLLWNKQITEVVNNIGILMDWWNPIQADFNRQISEGRVMTKEAEQQREDQISSLRSNFGKLYAMVITTTCPNSCLEAHQTLLQYLDKYQSQLTSAIAYNSTNNERDRLDANTKLNECNALWTQFVLQYETIKQEWDL